MSALIRKVLHTARRVFKRTAAATSPAENARYNPRDLIWRPRHIRIDRGETETLWDATEVEDTSGWKIFTDKTMGGSSTGGITLKGGAVVFEGNLVTELTEQMIKNEMELIGYAAARLPEFEPYVQLSRFDCFALNIKTDDRVYVFQVRCDMAFEEDLYQAIIPVAKPEEVGQFREVLIPFDAFSLTHRGLADETNMLYDGIRTEWIGFLSAQRRSGPFQMAIKSIKAVTKADFDITKKRYTGIDPVGSGESART